MQARTYSTRIFTSTLCVVLCCLLVGVFFGNAPVSASLCQINNISENYPQPAQPGGQVQLSTFVGGICNPAEQQVYYSVRVDIHDAQTTQVLSMTSVPIGYLVLQNHAFSVNVPNAITAPNSYDSWQLTVIVYVFANFEFVANGIDTSAVDQITLQVGSLQTTTTSSVQTSVATVTATIAATTTSASQGSNIQTGSAQLVLQQENQTVTLLILAVVAVALVAVVIVQRAKKSKVKRGT